MKIQKAIESLINCEEKFLKETNAKVSIKYKGTKIEIPYEALRSNDWGTSHEVNDPEFEKGIKDLAKALEDSGPLVFDGDEAHSLN